MQARLPLKIVHVVFSFDYGGLERRILRLIDGLAPLGARFSIVSLRHSDGTFLEGHPEVEHVVLDARPGIDWRAIRRLAAYLRESGAHIVHSHNWVSMLEGIVAGRLSGVPVVVHGEHGASRFEPSQLHWKRRIVQSMLAHCADSIIPVNESIRDRIVDVWKLPADRCTVIPNGVDTAKFHAPPRPANAPLVIGSLSRLESIKNFPCLIRAVNHLNRAMDVINFKLVIVGEGSERSSLEKLVQNLGAESYVSLPGASDQPETWYPQFDIYVNCSYSEGMSNTVLEAMSCSRPIVATDVPGHSEWLVEEQNALFFRSDDFVDLSEKLLRLASDNALRTAMGNRNREHVLSDFSQLRFINSYAGHYRDLLHAKGIRGDVL